MKDELIKATNQLATVRDWCEIPEETYAGINGVLDWLNKIILRQTPKNNTTARQFDKPVREIFLDWKNNYLTVDTMAELYLVDRQTMKELISLGKKVHEIHVKL